MITKYEPTMHVTYWFVQIQAYIMHDRHCMFLRN